MLKTKFYLKDSKNAESLLVCAVFQYSSKLISISTGIKTPTKHWNKNTQEFKSSSPLCKESNEVLNNIRRKVLNLSIQVEEIEDITELKQFLKSELAGKTTQKAELTFYEYFEEYYNEKVEKLSHNTYRVYKVLPEKLRAYEEMAGVKLYFNYWNIETMTSFADFLSKQGYLNDTINNNMKSLKAFLNWSYKKHHTNTRHKEYKVVWESHNVISLTADELNRIYTIDLSLHPNLDRIRDMFCIGVYTAQRFSDLQQLVPAQIEGDFWTVHSLKTHKLLKIPLSKKVHAILQKYDYNPPKISNQKFNKYLKRVGELAGIDSPVQKVSYSGVNKTTNTAPKYEFMSSHTARRTGITLLIERGVPLPMIQKITGHSNIKTLLRYDGTTINNLFAYLEEF